MRYLTTYYSHPVFSWCRHHQKNLVRVDYEFALLPNPALLRLLVPLWVIYLSEARFQDDRVVFYYGARAAITRLEIHHC